MFNSMKKSLWQPSDIWKIAESHALSCWLWTHTVCQHLKGLVVDVPWWALTRNEIQADRFWVLILLQYLKCIPPLGILLLPISSVTQDSVNSPVPKCCPFMSWRSLCLALPTLTRDPPPGEGWENLHWAPPRDPCNKWWNKYWKGVTMLMLTPPELTPVAWTVSSGWCRHFEHTNSEVMQSTLILNWTNS